jgi:hypothetical protein
MCELAFFATNVGGTGGLVVILSLSLGFAGLGAVTLGVMSMMVLLSDGGERGADEDTSTGGMSGKGYSNRVLSFAKGVPTIWEDGECSLRLERFTRRGMQDAWDTG